MARGQHERRTGLLSRLWPRRRRGQGRLEAEVRRTRALAEASALGVAAALRRAAVAADVAVVAELRAVRAELELASARREAAALRADLAALREELVWAFAEGKLPAPPTAMDLTAAARTA
jgi:hypothetical protein